MWEAIKAAFPSIIKFAERQGAAFLAMIAFLLFMYSILINSQIQNEKLNAEAKAQLSFMAQQYFEVNKKLNEILIDQIAKSNVVIENNTKILEEFNMYNRYKNNTNNP